ncbi:MAG: right-handed parallel beta-helix repeat-containing protein [Janthinobacterium lividum]
MLFSRLKSTPGVFALLLASLALPASAADYYVAAAGNDASAGTAPSSAWRSLNKVNNFNFKSGDRLFFEGGQTFAGTMKLTAADGGTASNPVIIGSYGSGRATINGGASSGLTITGATGIRVNNLTFVGLGRKTGNNGGTGVAVSGATSVSIDQVEASGFQHAGVDFYNSTNVRLTNVYAHDNGFAGISAYNSSNAYVGYCRALNNPGDPTITTNHSGSGIILSVRMATVEYCEAANNGYDMQQTNSNGPVGIWCYDSDQVTIQYCISHNNQSPKDDGGGFDLDGGVTNSVVQYNYAYENKNYGFLAWEYGSPTKWTTNTYRYNISVNNSGPGLVLGSSGGQGINNCQIYNNIFYNSSYPAVAQYGGATSFYFRNNLFVGPNSGSMVPSVSNLYYQANDYWFTTGGFNVGNYGSLTAWANATGQEKLNGTLVGLNADPQLRAPASYEKLTDPTKLSTLTAFLVAGSSPIIDKGLNLKTLFGVDPGARDFYGQPLPASASFDMGAQEQAASTTTPAPTQAPAPTPTPQLNMALNPSFEADGTSTQTPQRWSTWAGSKGTDADADYTETNGGGHGGTFHGTHYKGSAYEVYTYQVAAGLSNGLYTLRAWTKSSGGQAYAMLLAKNYGGTQVAANVPTTTDGNWQQVTVPNISITNGQCELGVYSYAGAGQWLYFDDVELVKQTTSSSATSGTAAVAALMVANAEVSAAPNEPLGAWPNPAHNALTVSYPAAQAAQLDVRIISLQAQTQLRQQQAVLPGPNRFTLDTGALRPGIYLLRISDGQRVHTQRLSVE